MGTLPQTDELILLPFSSSACDCSKPVQNSEDAH